MASPNILDRTSEITWDYDRGADVLYLSIGDPKPALGVDIGEGLILRYNEETEEIVGLTLVGLKDRLLKGLGEGKSVK